MKSTHPEPPPAGATYEKRDTNIRIVLISGASLAALVVFTLLLVRWVDGYITAHRPVRETVPPALLDSHPQDMTGPRVRAQPRIELVELRRAEEVRLTGYSRDRYTGTLHIPVEQAMRLVLKRGLPVRPGETATQPARLTGAGVNPGQGQD